MKSIFASFFPRFPGAPRRGRIGTLVAQIHQAEKESLTKSAEAASLEVALQDLSRGDQFRGTAGLDTQMLHLW